MNSGKIKESKYKTIGEIAKILNLVNEKTGQLETHTLRYWEKQFVQIKPSVRAGGRRYYSEKDLNIIKRIKYLLKEKGLTINGVKKLLKNKDTNLLDDSVSLGVYKSDFDKPKNIKDSIKKIAKIVKQLKELK